MPSLERALETLTAHELRSLVKILDVECPNKRDKWTLISSISDHGANHQEILSRLTVARLKEVAAALRVSTKGTWQQIADRLVSPNFDDVLDHLSASDLKAILDHFEIESSSRRELDIMKAAIRRASPDPAEVLSLYSLSSLKDFAAWLDLPKTGSKAELIERLTGTDQSATAPAPKAVDTAKAKSATARKATGKSEANELEAPAKEVDQNEPMAIAVFRAWLQVHLDAGSVSEGATNFGFCPICTRRHARRWFQHHGKPEGFYLCYTGEPTIAESKNDGSDFALSTLEDYVEKHPVNAEFTEELKKLSSPETVSETAPVSPNLNPNVAVTSVTPVTAPAAAKATESATTVPIAAATEAIRRSIFSRLVSAGRKSITHLVSNIRVEGITMSPPFIEIKLAAKEFYTAGEIIKNEMR